MKDKKDKKTTKENKDAPAEKPISLWGASFTDVMKALLDTKPMPKESDQKKEKGNGKSS